MSMKTYTKNNLPKHEVRHSFDGFNWGYGGSGSSELARCLMLEATGTDSGYQSFKFEHVATWDDSWSITDEEIRHWQDKHLNP